MPLRVSQCKQHSHVISHSDFSSTMSNLQTLLYAHVMNEQACDQMLYQDYPIFYDGIRKRFYLRKGPSIIPWMVSQVVIIFATWPLLSCYVILSGLFSPSTIYSADEVFVTSVQFLFCLLCIVTNFRLYKAREEVIECMNNLLLFYESHVFPIQKMSLETSRWTVYKKELEKVKTGKCDWFALLSNFVMVNLLLVPYAMQMVLIVTRLDPFSLALKELLPKGTSAILNFVLSMSLSFYCCLEGCRSIRFLLSLFMTILHLYTLILRKISATAKSNLQLGMNNYRVLYSRAFNNCNNTLATLIGSYMLIGFLIDITVGTALIIGYKVFNTLLLFMASVVLVVAIPVEIFALTRASYQYEFSDQLLVEWRHRNALGKDRNGQERIFRSQLLRSMKHIYFQCGNIGKIKRESNRMYFKEALIKTCDVCLFLRKYLRY